MEFCYKITDIILHIMYHFQIFLGKNEYVMIILEMYFLEPFPTIKYDIFSKQTTL